MVNVGSLPVTGNALFDLESQAGVMALLQAIRVSELSTDEKNELRDLVFLFTNGGKDQGVRLSLEQKISVHALTPAAPRVTVPVKPHVEKPTIGTFRSEPSFVVPPAPVVAPVVPVAPVAPVAPAPVESVVPPTPAAPVAPVRPAPAPVTPPAPEPVVMSAPEPVTVPTPEPVAPIAVQVPAPDQQQYLDRIREIKSLVNEKVGNPVNLVDINNEVGREYMGALLDAMKKINGGGSAAAAMERLEQALVAVNTVLENRDAGATASQSNFSDVDVAPVTLPVSTYTPPPAEPVPQNIPVTTYTPPPVAPAAQPFQAWQAPTPVVPTPDYNQQPAPMAQSTPAWTQPPAPVAPAPAPAPTVHAPAPGKFSSLADLQTAPRTSTHELPTTPSASPTLAAGDPLMAPDVESGLDQLLAEWSIFKKSGIFGSGPKGRQHPLYIKMANLQIPLLLAGRFEGATDEVRQSLTDYMNGWRYEQGLIYEKGEVFEHYLRRVIRHILDLQKG